MSRDLYSRQKSLNLKKYSTCIVIGCGGIGNWVAFDVALIGMCDKIVVIDPDIVEESNLNRTLFDYSDISTYKVDAIAKHIKMRRDCQLYTICEYMSDALAIKMIEQFIGDNSYYHSDIVVIDCRDDIYDDCYKLNCKLYKVGYDGTEITIDGNPRLTKVYGQRGGSYTVTPSYVCSSQLAAILVVNDIFYPKLYKQNNNNDINLDRETFPYIDSRPCFEHDEYGRLNDAVSFDCVDIIGKFVEEPHEYVVPDFDYSNLPNIVKED